MWGSGVDPEPVYCRSRAILLDHLRAGLGRCDGNALVAWDFPFGYPHSSGLGGGRQVAERFAEMVEDDEAAGCNNRFEVAEQLNRRMGEGPGPFWGYMGGDPLPTLGKGKPEFPVDGVLEHRIVERAIREARDTPGFISSVWQLSYSGCVGGQAIMGLASIARLHQGLHDGRPVRFWPFDTSWDSGIEGVVHVECWPSLFAFDHIEHPIRDARQVAATRDVLVDACSKGEVDRFLGRPAGLTDEELKAVEAGEGWIAGFRTGRQGV